MIKYIRDRTGTLYASVKQDLTGIIYTVANIRLPNGVYKQRVVKIGKGFGLALKSIFALGKRPLMELVARTEVEAEENVKKLAELVNVADRLYEESKKKALEDILREHKEKKKEGNKKLS